MIEIAQQLEAFGLDQKNLIKIIIFLGVLIVATRLQLSRIIEDFPSVTINKLSKNVNKLLILNIFFYGVLNILVYAIFDWLNKIFAEFFLQTIIFAVLTIILILNQSTLLVNNQFNSTKEAIKSTNESIETINEFLGGLNLNTFRPIRSLVKFLLDFYSLLYTPIYREDFTEFSSAISKYLEDTNVKYKKEVDSLLTLRFQRFNKSQIMNAGSIIRPTMLI